MKFLTFIRHAESLREAGPPQTLMHAMGESVQHSLRSGVLVDTGGLLPSVRGDLLEKLGRLDEAQAEYSHAAALASNPRERALLLRRADALRFAGTAAH